MTWLSFFRRALEAFERTLGPDHSDSHTSVNNLALLLRDNGKYDEAEPLFRRTLEARERMLGPDHPDMLSSVNNLASLLRIQPYIKSVGLQTPTDHWTHDCDPFRDRMFNYWRKGRPAMAYTCDVLGIPFESINHEKPWLIVDEPAHVDDCPVVVNRTHRYNNPAFPWRRVVEKYRGKMVFVGFEDEWERFSASYGIRLPFCKTDNVLELARLIAGCTLFVGNQSLAHAIAEGLKQHTVLEVSPLFPTCMFRRSNVWFGFDKKVHLPEIQ
jgi:hypothetical protein